MALKSHQRTRSTVEELFELVEDLDESQIHLLLEELDNTGESNVPVSKGIDYFEKAKLSPRNTKSKTFPIRTQSQLPPTPIRIPSVRRATFMPTRSPSKKLLSQERRRNSKRLSASSSLAASPTTVPAHEEELHSPKRSSSIKLQSPTRSPSIKLQTPPRSPSIKLQSPTRSPSRKLHSEERRRHSKRLSSSSIPTTPKEEPQYPSPATSPKPKPTNTNPPPSTQFKNTSRSYRRISRPRDSLLFDNFQKLKLPSSPTSNINPVSDPPDLQALLQTYLSNPPASPRAGSSFAGRSSMGFGSLDSGMGMNMGMGMEEEDSWEDLAPTVFGKREKGPRNKMRGIFEMLRI